MLSNAKRNAQTILGAIWIVTCFVPMALWVGYWQYKNGESPK